MEKLAMTRDKWNSTRSVVIASISLIAGTLASTAMQATTITEADGPRHCVDAPGTRDEWSNLQDGDTCRVVAFGLVQGSTPPVYYQLQAYLAKMQTPEMEQIGDHLEVGGPENDGAGVTLLVPAPERTRLTVLEGWSGSDAVVRTPYIVKTRQGTIIVVEMGAMISSRPNDDAVFRAISGKWVRVKDDWSTEINIPQSLNQRHGSAMDWPTLRAYGAFWKPDDDDCCPTGGSYIAQLRLDGTKLRLGSVRYSRHDLSFP